MLAKEHVDDLPQRNGNGLANDGAKTGTIGARCTQMMTTANQPWSWPRSGSSALRNPSCRWKAPASTGATSSCRTPRRKEHFETNGDNDTRR